jgi:magnesium transporter
MRASQQMTPESRSFASDKTGLPPGALVHVGSVMDHDTRIRVFDYNKDNSTETEVTSIDELLQFRDRADTVTWVLVEGLADVGIVERIGEIFGIHQLVLEDILNTHQRPKFEEFEDYLFIVIKALTTQGEEFIVCREQISLLLLNGVVLCFKEKQDDVLLPVQQRIRTSKGRLCGLGADFLTYSIIDAVVDQSFVLIDSLDEALTTLEDQLLTGEPDHRVLHSIQRLKREIVDLRRHISPVRELVNGLLRCESDLIDETTHIYFRDVSDHAIRIIESIELHRDIISGLLDIYISSVSNKMNEVMKVLTVFASIFIPLTFLTGIYGMNFEYMPELKLHWAYPAIWVAFLLIPTTLLVYFKRRKWL